MLDYPNHSQYIERRIAIATLATFNDVIIRQAFQAGIPLIDLRLTCNEPQDYANPIEPSAIGGKKITNVIMYECSFRTQFSETLHSSFLLIKKRKIDR